MISTDPDSHNNSEQTITDYQELSAFTHAKSYNITDPFDGILEDIQSTLSDTYLLSYKIPNPVFNGEKRKVEIEIKRTTTADKHACSLQSQSNSDDCEIIANPVE
ncbi:hypothetical protein [Candidatus Venteria ishoeyi]|uniref:Uncharacterized protein n=1 Tax=Candidatus Venteria ishoeyi TaxID=1899563 RepID=A0A1H6F4L0_9GAMM|nr:hypothetical protein [Candidatus Venteria ishoeyi]SEH05098.1 Uncharacterised protein [Candidatus Venteria ishoeyi]